MADCDCRPEQCVIPDVSATLVGSGSNDYGNFDFNLHGNPCPGIFDDIIRTDVRTTPNATDDWVATEKAIRDALDALGGGGGGVSGNGTDNNIPKWDGTDDIQDSGLSINDSNQLILTVGTEGNPALVFAGALTSGLYYNSGISNKIGLSLDGSDSLYIDSILGTVIESNLLVNGSFTFNGGLFNSPISFVSGLVSATSWYFGSDTNTGAYYIGSDNFGFATGGSKRIDISNTRTEIENLKLASSSSIIGTIRTDLRTTGSADDVSIVTEKAVRDAMDALVIDGGGVAGSGTDNQISRWNGTDTVQGSGWSILDTGELRQSVTNRFSSSGALYADYGDASLPGQSFAGDTNTGSFRAAVDTWGLATGGSERFRISTLTNGAIISNVATEILRFNTSAITCKLPVLFPYGDATNPGMAFDGDPNTGWIRATVDSIGAVLGGAEKMRLSPITGGFRIGNAADIALEINSTLVRSYRAIRIDPSGDATNPSLYWGTDTNAGFFKPALNIVSLTLNGEEKVRFSHVTNGAKIGFGTNDMFEFFSDHMRIHAPMRIVSDGDATNPSLYWGTDTNCGVFHPGLDEIAFANNGTETVRIQDNGNIGIGNNIAATTGNHVVTIGISSADQTSQTDRVHIFVRDMNGAGTAGLFMRNEAINATLAVVGINDRNTSLSSGVGDIALTGGSNRQNAGWARMYAEDGSEMYMPYWTDIS